jgi:hypothetical protein
MALPEFLIAYGQAWRGSWIDFDGRTLRDDTEVFAEWVRHPETYPGDEVASERFGFCMQGGNGHWTEFCDSYREYGEEGSHD